jgi:hypothetical protein
MPAAYLARKIVSPVKGSSLPMSSRGLGNFGCACATVQQSIISVQATVKRHATVRGLVRIRS